MKRTSSILVLLIVCMTIVAQSVHFSFEAGTADYASFSKATAESNISRLLTEINRADRMNTALNLANINMEEAAKAKLGKFWSNMHFSCEDDENIEKCLQDAQGYQVRNIPVTLHPLDNTYHGSVEKTIVISLNRRGQISGVRTALDRQDYRSIMETGKVVTDERQRREILKFVEDFRCYYNEKDIASLRKVFSDDAIIITGSVITTKVGGDVNAVTNKIIYKQSTKEEYLNKLQKIFSNNKFVDVGFDEISVKRNGATGKERFYGVTLKQKWHTDRYSDEGYLFLLWEFKDNGEPPVIHIRAWQPDKYPDGKPMQQDDILDMNDFV
ncbi:MAG: nuclear transport factor 2 family protein, partial [Prevotella sp.]|nr:nuclear transport factor 2 family protein [Prevotella sp.]